MDVPEKLKDFFSYHLSPRGVDEPEASELVFIINRML